MAHDSGQWAELAACLRKRRPIFEDVCHLPWRVAVGGGIDGDGPKAGVDKGGDERPPVRPAALPAVRQKDRRALAPR